VPVSNLTLMRATALFSAIGLAVLLAMVALSFWMLERTRASTEEVLATREIRSNLADLLSVVQDAETGQRGYLLTGEDRYLSPYESAVANTGPQLNKLAKAMAKAPGHDEFIAALRKSIDAKLVELSETVELKKAGKSEEALALVKTDRGKDVMDTLRGQLLDKRNQIEAQLYGAIAEQQSNANALRWTTIGGGLLIVLAAIGTAWAMANYTREIVRARAEVEALNATLESRVKERTTDLQRANEEIQRFAYIVSHDLRAPLVNVMGFTTELKASLESIKALTDSPAIDAVPEAEAARAAVNTDFPESIGFIQSSTRKMDGLINAILKLSREGQRTLRPEAVNLDTLFKGISDSTQHRLTETEGEMVIESPLPTIVSDRLALEQVFGNLTDNAIKYRAKNRAPRIDVRVRHDRGGTILIEVADNGRGIGPEDHDRVFDLFRRAGAQDQAGEGIGLAHVRALVRRLGGQITLTSELGIGTTFRVRLPRHLKTQAQTEQAGELRG
jgi:signal transduction histidine kinase